MSRPRLEKRRAGFALVTDARLKPFGYLRGDKLSMKSEGDCIEFTPEDFERLAAQMREINAARTVNATRIALLRPIPRSGM